MRELLPGSRSNTPDILRLFIAILVTTVVSCANAGLTARHYTTAAWLYNVVSESRATVQLVVQLLSTLLAVLQTYVASSLIRFRTNIFLETNGLQLDTIKFFEALWVPRLDLELPLHYALVVGIYIAAAQAAAAIWTASLTPVLTSSAAYGALAVPSYQNISIGWHNSNDLSVGSVDGTGKPAAGNWSNICRPNSECGIFIPTTTQDAGTFTHIPWKEQTGLIIDIVSTASSYSVDPPNRTRLDNTGFTYLGRSYGMGASVGLVEPSCSGAQCDNMRSLQYADYGYDAQVECLYNASSDLRSEKRGDIPYNVSGTSGGITLQEAIGSLPNGDWDSFPTWTAWGGDTSVIIAASAKNDRFLLGFLAGNAYYRELNQVQCEVWFAEDEFVIDADYAVKTINVTKASILRAAGEFPPRASSIHGPVFEPSGKLMQNAFMQLSYVSVTMSSLYTSVLGNAFVRNYESVAKSNGNTKTTSDDILFGIQQSIEAVIDASLISFGASQIMLVDETFQQKVEVTQSVAKLGEARYVYAAFGLNILLLVVVVLECILTKFWVVAPRFNVLDTKTALLLGPRIQDQNF